MLLLNQLIYAPPLLLCTAQCGFEQPQPLGLANPKIPLALCLGE